ncbi:MAG: valine--tRNA ligase, partial [Dehalococcoidia bacterium]|nr:valine--tRNA ligase [Dehalococcoidia bacterium]
RVIPIIADEAVDRGFGTGAVKITPSHDPVDFEVARRNNLPFINILNPDGTMNENAGPYQGLDRFECRRAILADLERDGLYVKEEIHPHAVGHCSRCQTAIEPLASKQWFVKIAPLAKPAIEAVVDGRITIIPERFTRVYLNWMENLRDWCISRQLWWGHRIPVWYCGKCNGITVSVEDPSECSHCRNSEITQDPDVLDTWFSSGLWPHSTLGWPGDTEDLGYFYPTSVMETGYDILFFWVARMIMMGLENMREVPFSVVYLHGLIRDESGEKMSKMKGNVINPIEAIDKYGTDALRFSCTTGSSPGNDIRLSWQKLEAGRNFCNKIWNSARYVESCLGEGPGEIARVTKGGNVEERWILSRLNRLLMNVNNLLKDYQFGEAERQIHDFMWGEFCDWFIELSKIRLRSGGEVGGTKQVLFHVLETSLRLMHPFMPFITEEIWQRFHLYLPVELKQYESIMIAPYPTADESAFDEEAEKEMESIIEIIRSVRNARSEFSVEPARLIEARIYAGEAKDKVSGHAGAIESLARVQPLFVLGQADERPAKNKALTMVLKDCEVALPMEGMIDIAREKNRLQQELSVCEAEYARYRAKLEDVSFVTRAPSHVVERDRGRLGECESKVTRLRAQLNQLMSFSS